MAHVGSPVRAGQILGFMGDTDPLPLGIRSDVPTDATVDIPVDAVAPHIRLTIRDLDGTPVDAYGPVIDALFRQVCSIGTGPWSSPPTGAGFERVVTETTDDKREIDSEWVITETGQVTASGWAAMIYPSESCGFAPEDARGPVPAAPATFRRRGTCRSISRRRSGSAWRSARTTICPPSPFVVPDGRAVPRQPTRRASSTRLIS